MSFLFKHKTRTPAELVKQIKVDLENIVDLGGKMHKKLSFNGIKEGKSDSSSLPPSLSSV